MSGCCTRGICQSFSLPVFFEVCRMRELTFVLLVATFESQIQSRRSSTVDSTHLYHASPIRMTRQPVSQHRRSSGCGPMFPSTSDEDSSDEDEPVSPLSTGPPQRRNSTRSEAQRRHSRELQASQTPEAPGQSSRVPGRGLRRIFRRTPRDQR